MTEFWLRGPLIEFSPTLMPVAHALLQASEDLEVAISLNQEQLWQKPGQAASVGFHLKHISGSIDRLLTYAQGQQLNPEQLTFLKQEAMASETAVVLVAKA